MNYLKKPAIALIVVSLIAALAILAASAWLEGSSPTITYIIIAIWWIPFSILTMRGQKQSENDTD